SASLSPHARHVAVLQLPPHRPHWRRRAEAVVGAGDPPRPSTRPGAWRRRRARRGVPRQRPAGQRVAARMSADYRDFYRGRRVMVAGGLGFIGSNLARQLAALGADILLVDSLIAHYV